MKRSIKHLEGFTLKETDGEIGKVEEFYFDDQSWTIRYLIVKTGNWFSGKKVLISSSVIQHADWENEKFLVKLTQKQIETSPDIDTDKPVSRQQEELLAAYYSWEEYWGTGSFAHGGGIFGMMPSELYESGNEQPENLTFQISGDDGDKHLRSTEEIKGYPIHTTDGEIGKVVDYIVDDSNWKIDYLIVDTGNWLDSKKIILSTKWITGIKWDHQIVIVNIDTDKVKSSPDYDESLPLSSDYENSLNSHYKGTVE